MVKEKMYDFGELGKWSLKTLKAQLGDMYYVVIIYETYYRLVDELKEEIESCDSVKIKSLTLSRLSEYLDDIRESRDRLKKLKKDYKRYNKVIDKLVKK